MTERRLGQLITQTFVGQAGRSTSAPPSPLVLVMRIVSLVNDGRHRMNARKSG